MWGRLLGTGFGFLFGKWLGAVLGFYLGHLFDKSLKQDFNKAGGFQGFFDHSGVSKKQALFSYTCFAVMGHIAKSNGRVSESHISAASLFMDEMGLTGDARKQAQDAFRSGKDEEFPIKRVLKEFKERFAGRFDLLQLFLEIQIQMAFCDGVLSESEKSLLALVSKGLGINKVHFNFILKRYQAEFKYHKQQQKQQQGSSHQAAPVAMDTKQALHILGLETGASKAEIKKAYRKLMAQHHPDKLVSQGLPEQMMKVAVQKSQDIQQAYELLKKEGK